MDRETGIFINGKNQAIKMLSLLSAEEKEKIIRQIKNQDPRLASELFEQSMDFNMILELDEADLKQVTSHIHAGIFGVALKGLSPSGQKQVLARCPRPYAEEAFSALNAPLNNQQRNVARACERVKNVIVKLLKSHIET